ncbi:metal ABC transporter ATP-binding protein [Tatumella saanichensis]|uniref:metal ABC transporter ATP-binding protein n=1 Tax=Tatumella saanichensis TaxID=480813 RepID=UPI0004B2CCFB|nr:ATP-binding cassette domain-containing protein [Tatumella saanichensis]
MIRFNDCQAGYGGRAVTPLVNGEITPGTLTALVGVNGCGKSTLLKTVAGLQPAVAGKCEVSLPRKKIGWLPQRSDLERQFPLTVFELVAMGCWPRTGWFRSINAQLRQEIYQALAATGMQEFAEARPAMLSGGQLQRVLFSRLLLQQSDLWLLDEPFSGVDQQTISSLMTLIHRQQQAGTTIVVVLHDQRLVMQNFRQVLSLEGERAHWYHTTDKQEKALNLCC